MGPPQDEPSLDQASVDGRAPSLADPRQARDAPLGHQRFSSVDDGSADLAAGLAEIGLTPKAAWYSAVSERVRLDELVARRGGDEFVVVIDDAEPQYAEAVVQRIDDAIARARRRICPDLRPTACVTSVPWRPGETPADFLHEADIALHDEKARSRVQPRSSISVR
jgi:hypothetical protein